MGVMHACIFQIDMQKWLDMMISDLVSGSANLS